MKSMLLFIGLVGFIPTINAKSDDSLDGIQYYSWHKLFSNALVSCPTITFPCSRIPNVCANMQDAINNKGKPSTLNRITDANKIAKNRRDSGCRSLPKVPGQNCDEYPFASSSQGGLGAVIRNVPSRENSIQGGLLGGFYRSENIGDGDCYNVAFGP